MRTIALGVAVLVAASLPARAQVVMDGSTGTAGALGGPNYAITSDLGVLKGDNLFHSFDSFDLSTGDVATWSSTGADSLTMPVTAGNVLRVINRVTGGTPSDIDGKLNSSAYANADFYFINPAGVTFTENTSLDVPKGFFVSTADNLHMSDSTTIAMTSATSNFVSAPPEAFGFLGSSNTSINLTGTIPDHLEMDFSTGSASFISSNVDATWTDIDIVRSTGAGEDIFFDIVAVGEDFAGNILLSPSLRDRDQFVVAGLGDITLSGFFLTEQITGTGVSTDIFMSASNIDIDGSRIETEFDTSTDSPGSMYFSSDVLDISNSFVSSVAYNRAGFRSSDHQISILANELNLTQRSEINSQAIGGIDTGDINIDASTIHLGSQSDAAVNLISIDVWPEQLVGGTVPSSGGKISIMADNLVIEGNAAVRANTMGAGTGGDISILVNNLILNDWTDESVIGGIASTAFGYEMAFVQQAVLLFGKFAALNPDPNIYGHGTGGDISIVANDISVAGQSQINSSTFSTGDAGSIQIETDHLEVKDSGVITSGAISIRNVPFQPHQVLVTSALIGPAKMNQLFPTLTWSSVKDNETAGNAGSITINAEHVELLDGGQVSASSIDGKDAGDITIISNLFEMTAAVLLSFTTGSGDGGAISVSADETFLSDGSVIASSTLGAGSAGTVHLAGQSLTMDMGPLQSSSTRTVIVSSTSGFGSGGVVKLDVSDIKIGGNSVVASITDGSGNSGSVIINADKLVIDGSGIVEKRVIFENGGISAQAGSTASGKAGEITVNVTGAVELLNGGQISTFSEANSAVSGGTIDGAGDINITAGSLLISGGASPAAAFGPIPSAILSRSIDPFQSAGDISIIVRASAGTSHLSTDDDNLPPGSILMEDGAFISSNVAVNGNVGAGEVFIDADSLTLTGVSPHIGTSVWAGPTQLLADTAGAQDAGTFKIHADHIKILDGAQVRSSTSAGGDGGVIVFCCAKTFEVSGEGSQIIANSDVGSTGDAGLIIVKSEEIVINNGARVEVSTNGSGKGGQIVLKAHTLTLKDDDLNDAGSSITTTISGAATDVTSPGAGQIIVLAGEMIVQDGSFITTDSEGPVPAGQISIRVGKMTVTGTNTKISSEAGAPDSRNAAGVIDIGAVDMTVSNGATLSTESDIGAGGTLLLGIDNSLTVDGATLSTDVGGKSDSLGGNIVIGVALDDLHPEDNICGGLCTNFDPFANIIQNDDTDGIPNDVVLKNSEVKAQNDAGDGGSVTINGGKVAITNTKVSANADEGNGGNLTINADFILLDAATLVANADEGNGGNILLQADLLFDNPERPSTITASSNLGIEGTVEIDAVEPDVDGQTQELDDSFLSAADVLASRCAAQRQGQENIMALTGKPMGAPGEAGQAGQIHVRPGNVGRLAAGPAYYGENQGVNGAQMAQMLVNEFELAQSDAFVLTQGATVTCN